MSERSLSILLVEDEPAHAEAIRRAFQSGPARAELHAVESLHAYRAFVSATPPDIALLDLNLPDGRALEILVSPAEEGTFPVLIMTSFGNEQVAVEAMRAGALDYIVKSPETFSNLPRTVDRALREWGLLLARRRDAHELRVTRDTLQESEARFRAAFDQASVGRSLTLPDGRLARVNRTLCKMLGYSAAELATKGFADITHPDDLAESYECVRALLAGELHSYGMEKRYIRSDGSVLWTEVSTTLIRDEQGKPINFVTDVLDISERKRAEARTRAIYDNLPNPTLLWKRHQAGFLLADTNEAARAVTRGVVARFVGKPACELGDAFPHLDEDLASCFDRHAAVRREQDCTMPGGTEPRRLVLTYGFIPSDMVILHTEDVTEQRRTEEQLKVAQRLEAVGRLAGGVAHDFNNLLSIINCYAAFGANELSESDPVRGYVVEILDAGERAAALTRQLLAFSRKQVLQPEVVSLNRVVTGIENMLRRLLGEDIEVEVRLAESLGSVLADPGQIEQVIMNLAVNARDAMPEGGKLTIETTNVEVDEDYASQDVSLAPGRFVQVSVTDTGTGMDAATRQLIFEPFFTTKEKGRGTGLGLATVYGIIRQSGGDVSVYSEPGRGTTFKVYLPRVDSPVAEARSKTVSIIPTGSETVLVVEDEEAVRKLVLRILGSAGYHVLAAATGTDALELCENHQGAIDLLLTDVVMPQMSGRELAQRLGVLLPGVKVLFMSGYTDNAIVHHGVLDAGTHFIGKPFSGAELRRKVREAIDSR